jgi:hypothetical protein
LKVAEDKLNYSAFQSIMNAVESTSLPQSTVWPTGKEIQ